MTVEELMLELSSLDPKAIVKAYAPSHEYDVLGTFVSEDDRINQVYIDLSW